MDFLSQYYYYLSFFCGCAFLFFSLSCFVSWRSKFGNMSYSWIMLFGLSFAAVNFLQMFASAKNLHDLGRYSLLVSVIWFMSMIFFFMAAQETYLKFKPEKKFLEYLIIPCSLASMLIGFCFGLRWFNASIFVFMWIPSSIIMILSIYNLNKNDKYSTKSIFYIFIVFIIYCIVYSASEIGIILNSGIYFQALCSAVLSVLVFFIGAMVFKYFKVSHEKNVKIYDYMPVYWKHIPIGSILFAVLVAGLFFTMYLENYARSNIERNAKAVVNTVTESIEARLSKADQISFALSKTPFIGRNMSNPPDAAEKIRVNSLLEDYCWAFNMSMIVTVNNEGSIVFYSHQTKEPDIFNINMKYRPYFTEAMNSLHGSSLSKHLIGANQSYFSSDPIKNADGDIIGAVIVQENVDDIIKKLHEHRNIFVVDENGVILLSDKEDAYLNYLWPLYNKDDKNKNNNAGNILSREVANGDIVVLNGESYHVSRQFIGAKGWSVIYFSSLNPIKQFKALGISGVCGVLIIILLLFWSINQSNRILALALQHKAILNSAKSIIIVATDVQGNIVVYGQGAEDILGYTKEEFVAKGVENIMFDKEGSPMTFEESVTYSSSPSTEMLCRRRDGSVITLLVNVLPQYSVGNKLIGYIFSGADITATKETEVELAQQIKFLQMLIDSMPIAVYYKDSEMHIIGCNRAFENIMEHSKDFMIGKTNESIYFDKEAGEESARTDKIIAQNMSAITYEKVVKFRKVSSRNLIYYKSPYKKIDGKFGGIIGVILDVTKERKMQEERDILQSSMIQHNKLASLGELAGSIAHELNNPLSIILGYAQVLIKDGSLNGEAKKGVENIYEAAKRSRGIITNMLEFARTDTSKNQMVRINDIIEATMLIVEKDFNKGGIDIQKILTQDQRPVIANPMQIQQVLLNMLLNAKDSMPGGGKIILKTEIKNKVFSISISDTGSGIPKDVLNKIFDPFFTTKAEGKGTGLGLSICYGIINSHKGEILVESNVGKGTTFTIKLPFEQ